MKRELQVGNYLFTNIADADQARIEQEKINRLKDKLKGADTKLLYNVYNKSIEARTFRTPIGYDFMREYKEYLDNAPDTPGEVLPVPLYTTFEHSSSNNFERQVNFERQEKVRRAEKKKEDSAVALYVSIFANVILVILIIVMFILLNTSDSPTILNYKEKVIDQYSEWEMELKNREQAVKEKEQNLNINYIEETNEDFTE